MPGWLRRTATPRRLFILAGGFAAFALLLKLTGGFAFRVGGLRISAHATFRPMLLAMLFAAAGYRLLDDAAQERLVRRGGELARRVLWLVPLAAAVLVLWLGITRGVRSAGGSDVYGYISQSKLWLAGDLHVRQPFAASMPWPNADWTLTPLGYRPAADHTLLPTYAPGLPILMALFTLAIGPCAPYFLSPICGALLVAFTWDLGRRVASPIVGSMAALFVASSPIVLFMALTPMSDVPVAACWTAALALACRRTGASALAAGVAAGIALVIRPNLLPLALGPAAIAAWPHAARAAAAAGRLALYGAGTAPFALFVGWLFNHLYGSPLRSGYGDPGFAAAYFRTNLAHYPGWLLETQGPLVFVFLLTVLVPARTSRDTPPLRRILLVFTAAVLACYLWYLSFDGWPFLRFMLPALPCVFILAADTVYELGRRAGIRVQAVAVLAFAVIMVEYATKRGRDLDVLGIGRGEQKYAEVGHYVETRLPAQAVVLTMQHSGSIRYYSGRTTLRYDELAGDWLDRALAHLEATGREPWLLLEDWELAQFRSHFATERGVGIVDRTPDAIAAGGKIRLYRASLTAPEADAPETMPAAAGCR